MTKPTGATELSEDRNIAGSSIQEAINSLEINLTEKIFNLNIKISKWDLFFVADLVNQMNQEVINLNLSVEYEVSYLEDEWSIEDTDTNDIVWSPGA